MNNSKRVINAAFVGLITIGVSATATLAHAADGETEKCAGIIKAGKNDCGTTKVGCHGSITVDSDKEAWIEVPKGTCEKLVGAYVTDKPWNAPGGLAEYKKK
ncbi:MAG: DUF2282 domain-containing protein [Methylophilaceae bacterium]